MHVKTRKDCKTTDVIETQIWNKLRLMSFQHTTYPRILAGVCLLRILSWGEQKQEGLEYFLIFDFDFEPLVIVGLEQVCFTSLYGRNIYEYSGSDCRRTCSSAVEEHVLLLQKDACTLKAQTSKARCWPTARCSCIGAARSRLSKPKTNLFKESTWSS